MMRPLLERETFGGSRFVLRARAYRQRTESGAPDYCRFPSAQSGRVGPYHLRMAGLASAQRKAEEPGVRGVVAEVARAQLPAKFAGVAGHQATRRSSLSGRPAE